VDQQRGGGYMENAQNTMVDYKTAPVQLQQVPQGAKGPSLQTRKSGSLLGRDWDNALGQGPKRHQMCSGDDTR